MSPREEAARAVVLIPIGFGRPPGGCWEGPLFYRGVLVAPNILVTYSDDAPAKFLVAGRKFRVYLVGQQCVSAGFSGFNAERYQADPDRLEGVPTTAAKLVCFDPPDAKDFVWMELTQEVCHEVRPLERTNEIPPELWVLLIGPEGYVIPAYFTGFQILRGLQRGTITSPGHTLRKGWSGAAVVDAQGRLVGSIIEFVDPHLPDQAAFSPCSDWMCDQP